MTYSIINGFPSYVSIASEAEEGTSVTATAIGSGQNRIIIMAGMEVVAQTSDYVSAGATLTFTMPSSDVSVDVIAKPR